MTNRPEPDLPEGARESGFDPDASETLDSGDRTGSGSSANGEGQPILDEGSAETVDSERGEQIEIDPVYRPPNMPGNIAGFAIRSVIGSGGMGTVYLAQQDKPRRPVAIKVINPGVTNERALRRFEFETQMLARLSHPGIAQIYGAGMWDEGSGAVPYFAMEYIAGGQSIIEYAQFRNLGLHDRIRLLIGACEAVGYGHSKGVIHRDLKPGNILVTGDGRVKIIDFGVARSTDADAAATLATGVHDIVGTLQYMAPEQCAGDVQDLDFSADVYALGVTCFELLTGDLPYDVSTLGLAEAVRVITQEQPQRLGAIDRRFGGDLQTIVEKAMAKERSDRYRSAMGFGDDLKRYLDDEPVQACPPTLITTLRRTIRRNRTAVVGLALIAILLSVAAAAGVFALVNSNRALEARNETLTEQAHKQEMVSELIGYYMRDTFDAISAITANPEAREMLVAKNMEYLQVLRDEGGDDPVLRRVVAQGLKMAGHNAWSMRGGSRGEIDKAIRLWKESAAILDEVVLADPGDLKSRLLAIETHNALIQAYRDQGQAASARSHLEIAERYVEALPNPESDLSQWGATFQILDKRLLFDPMEGDPEADPTVKRLLELAVVGDTTFRTADGIVPTRVKRNITIIWNKVAYRYAVLENYEKALDYYRRALDVRLEILTDAEAEGTSLNFAARDVNNSRRYVANQLRDLARLPEAIVLLRDEVVPSASRLLADSPEDTRAGRDFAVVVTELGELYVMAGQWAEAVDVLEEARSRWRQSAEQAGYELSRLNRHTRETIRAEINLALARHGLGQAERAAAAIERADALADIARSQWPDDAKMAPWLAELDAARRQVDTGPASGVAGAP